jgi:hypothetical protein
MFGISREYGAMVEEARMRIDIFVLPHPRLRRCTYDETAASEIKHGEAAPVIDQRAEFFVMGAVARYYVSEEHSLKR